MNALQHKDLDVQAAAALLFLIPGRRQKAESKLAREKRALALPNAHEAVKELGVIINSHVAAGRSEEGVEALD